MKRTNNEAGVTAKKIKLEIGSEAEMKAEMQSLPTALYVCEQLGECFGAEEVNAIGKIHEHFYLNN
jgi:hypothetical protein